ncbi:LysR substrate-binding domain-containing protein [Myceligenerans halotolerans]
MELRQLEYLVALAEERQFTRAADLTGVSQSGLSAAIRSLEDELGTKLFDRTTRKVEPTEAGAALLPFARSMLGQAAAARDAVVHVSHELSGQLRVGAEQCLGLVDVPTVLERFHRRHPRVEVEFTQAGSDDLLTGIRERRLDVAFVAGTEQFGSLSSTRIGHEALVAVLPPGHPLGVRTSVEHGELARESFIDFHASWGMRRLNDTAFEARRVHRRVRFAVNDVHTLLDLVRRGLGVAVVPRHVAAKPQAASLTTVPLRGEVGPDWVVSLVTAPWAADSPAPHLVELVRDPPACREAHAEAVAVGPCT